MNTRSSLPRPPATSAQHLPRRRLSEPLLRASARMTLLCAPAGFGKSHLLRECAESAPADVELCWLDLRGAASLTDLTAQLSAAFGLQREQSLTDFLHQRRKRLWILLDHWPEHHSEESDGCLQRLLQASAPPVRWWVASRRRPCWPLTRWLLDGDLYEVGARQLAVDDDELAALAASHGASTLRADLSRRTANWFAGVKLHLLAEQGGQGTAGLDRLLANYLDAEVLSRLPPAIQDTLAMLAGLPSFDQSLYNALHEPDDYVVALSQLVEMGIFIETLPGSDSEFRVHPAVAPTLAARLPVHRRSWFYCRACQYFASAEKWSVAIEFAFLAQQPEMAASLMERLELNDLLYAEGFNALLQWRQRLPSELCCSSPKLVLLSAWAYVMAGRLDAARQCSDRLAVFLPQPDAQQQGRWLASWQLLAAQINQRSGFPQAAAELALGALRALPAQCWVEQILARMLLVEQGLDCDDLDSAKAMSVAAVSRAREQHCVALEGLLALQQAELLVQRGELARAQGLALRVLEESVDVSPLLAGRAHWHLGRCAWFQADMTAAQQHYAQALQLGNAVGDPAMVCAFTGLAELAASRAELDTAFETLSEATRTLQRLQVAAPLFRPQVELIQGKLWLLQGKHSRAASLASEALRQCSGNVVWPMPFGGAELRQQFELLKVRAELSEDCDASSLIERWLDRTRRAGRAGQLCELWFALSEAHVVGGRQRKAQAALFEGLAQARRLGGLGSECHWFSFRPQIGRWVDKLELEREEAASIDPGQLSRRERSVLGMIAEGLANQEIADRLHISLHTVKSHAQRINAKLGVSRRTQAIVRAKALGLLM